MLPTSAGVKPVTSWSPVGRRIQLSHRGRYFRQDCMCTKWRLRSTCASAKSDKSLRRDYRKLRRPQADSEVSDQPALLSTHKTLRKHAYSNILKISPPKNENFQIKYSDNFHISVQNIDCGYSLELPQRGGSNEYPQSMFLSRNKKTNVYPSKPQFYYIKVGFKGSKLYRQVLVMTDNYIKQSERLKTNKEKHPLGTEPLKMVQSYLV